VERGERAQRGEIAVQLEGGHGHAQVGRERGRKVLHGARGGRERGQRAQGKEKGGRGVDGHARAAKDHRLRDGAKHRKQAEDVWRRGGAAKEGGGGGGGEGRR
jgi:hypothetical protein